MKKTRLPTFARSKGRSRKTLREIAATTPADDPLEASIVKACLDYLNGLDFARFQKRHGTRTRSGEPDITGCLDGQHWEIEVKRGKAKPTKRQYSRLNEWCRAGAVVCWVSSKEELACLVAAVKAGCPTSPNIDIREYAHNVISSS